MNEEEKERLIKKDILSIENRVRHTFNQGYEMGLKERKNTCEDVPMREFTEEEAKAYSKALDKMYEPTGFNVFNEPCEDAISRAEAIKAMNDLEQEDIERYGCPIPEGFDGERAIEVLRSLPSVTHSRGHWIRHYDEDVKEGWYECDRCHTERAFNTDYCPDCGAKMVEPQELTARQFAELVAEEIGDEWELVKPQESEVEE